jgi:hypothetical protein
MLLTALTDAEFLRHAQTDHDPITASLTETELLRRFAPLVDKLEASESLLDVLADHDISDHEELATRLEQPDVWNLKPIGELTDLLSELDIADHAYLRLLDAMVTTALEHGIDTAQKLGEVLDRNRRFESLLSDLTDPLNTLNELAATA